MRASARASSVKAASPPWPSTRAAANAQGRENLAASRFAGSGAAMRSPNGKTTTSAAATSAAETGSRPRGGGGAAHGGGGGRGAGQRLGRFLATRDGAAPTPRGPGGREGGAPDG